MNKFGTTPSEPSEHDKIVVLVGTLPLEFDPEVKEIEKNFKITFSNAVEELRT